MNCHLENTLDHLLLKNQKMAQRFNKAGEKVGNKILKSLFFKLAKIHQQFADELRIEILLENSEPKTAQNPPAAFDNFWIDVNYFISDKNGVAVVGQCVREHRLMLKIYFSTLEVESLPVVVRNTLVRHWRTLKDIMEILKLEKVLAL